MSIEEIDRVNFFFIVGRQRSGTNLLRVLFDAHPDLLTAYDDTFIMDLYSKYGKIKAWDIDTINDFIEDVKLHYRFSKWKIDRYKFARELIMLGEDANFKRLIKVLYLNLTPFFDKGRISYIFENITIDFSQIKKTLKAFPDAKFIIISRDYRDNILSLKRSGFDSGNTMVLAYKWKSLYQQLIKLTIKSPSQFYNVTLENLIHDPVSEAGKLFNFLKVQFCPETLEYHKKLDRLDQYFSEHEMTYIRKYHSGLLKPINDSAIERWKKEMRRSDIKTADLIVNRTAEAMGYERLYKGKVRFIYCAALIPYHAVSGIKRMISAFLNLFISYRSKMFLYRCYKNVPF